MAAILYLDIDDEITTAAARIRGSVDPKVALVVPPGSRIATSRMNFRLLAREALERNRGLSIVAADPAARAIAGSAGLPVFASVAEFEASIAPPPPAAAPPPVEPAVTETRPGPSPAVVAGLAGAGLAAGPTGTPPSPTDGSPTAEEAIAPAGPVPPRRRRRGGSAGDDRPVAEAGTADALVTEPIAAATGGASAVAGEGPMVEPPATEPRARSRAAALPVVPAARAARGVSRWVVAGLIAVVALLAIAIAGYLVLPSATVVVTPSPVPVGPVDFVVRADPDATTVDAAGGVVPATRLSKEFTASGEFPSTGKRVVTTKATGTLRWTNCDPTRARTIAAGTVARTSSGVGFATDESLFLPVAIISAGLNLTCQSRDVPGTAVKAGPEGNVAAGAVKVVPGSLNSVVVKVTNPAAMAGGTREEFTRVSQKDVTAALASLTKDLNGQFAAWLAAPEELPAGSTVFTATGKLSQPIPDVDPSTLINVEEPTFQLGATATGTVVAVDASLVEQVATERISGSVPAEHRLVPGSVKVSADQGQADGDLVDFRVTASAAAIPLLDPAVLRDAIRGRPVEEAERILKQYGEVTIRTWPGFVTSIPSLDGRIDLTVAGDQGDAGSSPTPGASSPEPSGTSPTPGSASPGSSAP